jgi:hypothetical protein
MLVVQKSLSVAISAITSFVLWIIALLGRQWSIASDYYAFSHAIVAGVCLMALLATVCTVVLVAIAHADRLHRHAANSARQRQLEKKLREDLKRKKFSENDKEIRPQG